MTRAGLRTRRSTALIAAFLAALLFTAACAKKKRPPPAPAAPRIGWTENGIASWYGYPYHGRRAANGEVYDMELLTAAHRTLPFGAVVRVSNLDSGKEVTVRITDRGPFIEGRIIDLSKAAARSVEMIGPGIARVRVQLLAYGPPRLESPAANGKPRVEIAAGGGQPPVETLTTDPLPAAMPAEFAVQVGAFIDRNRAENLKRSLEQQYQPVIIVPRDGERIQYRVLVGRRASEDDARILAGELRALTGAAFVVRLDQ